MKSKFTGAQQPAVSAAELGRLLSEFLAAHQALLASIRAHRQAMRNADLTQMEQALASQQQCMEDIAHCERTRNTLAKSLTGHTTQRGPITLSDMIRAVHPSHDEAREQLLSQANELRNVIADVRREQSALGQAAAHLAAHVDGLMRLVVQKLSSAGVYGRTGRVDVTRAALSLDMRS